MEMQGSRTLAVTQQQAWEGLNDPEVLRACIPGCEKVERVAPDRFDVGMAVKVGPVSARFTGKITLGDVEPPQRYTLAFDGQGGAAGFGKGTARVQLTPAAAGCELAYSVQAQVGGRIAQVGQRLIDGVARSMAEDFFKRFEAEMQRRHAAPAPAADPEPAPTAAAQPSPASAQARTTIPAWTWIAVGLAVVAGAFWLLR